MPIGYLVTTAFLLLAAGLALAPRGRPPVLAVMSTRLGAVVNELPFIACAYLLASSLLAVGQHDIDSPGGWLAAGLAVLSGVALGCVVRRAALTGPAVDEALQDGLAPSGTDESGRVAGVTAWSFSSSLRVLLAPLLLRRRDVERVADISYGDAGRENRLDVYCHRSRPSGGPVLIHLHGGHFATGRKSREARPLFYRLASRGWVCVSANYRLTPGARFPDQLIDVKRVIAWVRQRDDCFGADPETVFLAGSSAGGNLAAQAALTPNREAFQPGFADVDTRVAGAIVLYGYFGPLDSPEGDSSPGDQIGPQAPPFFVAHGDRDTQVPVAAARAFADRLRQTSLTPVVFVELPGAHHAFDLFQSLRLETLIGGIESFAARIRARESSTHTGR